MINGPMKGKCSLETGTINLDNLCKISLCACFNYICLFSFVVQDGRLLFFAGGKTCPPDQLQTTLVRVYDMSVPEQDAKELTHGLKIGKRRRGHQAQPAMRVKFIFVIPSLILTT